MSLFRLSIFSSVLLACAASLRGQTLTFTDFTSTTGLKFNSSSVSSGIAVLADTGHDRGSFFTTSQYSVSTGFSAVFQFQISNPSGIADSTGVIGADGLAFVLQRETATVRPRSARSAKASAMAASATAPRSNSIHSRTASTRAAITSASIRRAA